MLALKDWPTVVIIVLNWNGWRDTIECLTSLHHITYPNFKVVVVDNGSGDDSLRKIAQFCTSVLGQPPRVSPPTSSKPFQWIKYSREQADKSVGLGEMRIMPHQAFVLIANEKNYGFAEGNNVGMLFALRNLAPDYLLILNNDTLVDPNFLSELVEKAEEDRSIKILAPIIFQYDGSFREDVIWFAGGKVHLGKYPGYSHLRRLPIAVKDVFTCDWVSGSAMMIRAGMAYDTLFDPRFFFGCEDVDLCLRAENHGEKIVLVPTSKVWHKVGSSRKKYEDLQRFMTETGSNMKFLRMYNDHFFLFIPLYILQFLFLMLMHCIKDAHKVQW